MSTVAPKRHPSLSSERWKRKKRGLALTFPFESRRNATTDACPNPAARCSAVWSPSSRSSRLTPDPRTIEKDTHSVSGLPSKDVHFKRVGGLQQGNEGLTAGQQVLGLGHVTRLRRYVQLCPRHVDELQSRLCASKLVRSRRFLFLTFDM